MSRTLVALAAAASVLTGWADEQLTTRTRGWQRLEPGGLTACARGGPYAFWLHRGDPKRLLVFFQGGGGCFSRETCALGSSWFDDRIDAGDDPARSGHFTRTRSSGTTGTRG